MVCRLPKTRHASPEDRALLDASARTLGECRDRLMASIDRDSAAYDAVVAAYRMARGSDEEKALRRDAVQRALQQATEVPLDVMRDTAAALAEVRRVADHANPATASDIGVAIELLRTASRGARLNVEINLGSVLDQTYAQRSRDTAASLSAEAERLADDVAGSAGRLG
jgi:formiminotetrahydrofolate cyclodeaminase